MMAEDVDNSKANNGEEEVWIAISAFEQILEAIPNDRASLEALQQAYEQVGDHTRAKDYLVRLARVLIEERDADAASAIHGQMTVYAKTDRDLLPLIGELEQMGGGKPKPRSTEPEADAIAEDESRYEAFSLADELAFAWALLEGNNLTQEEYAGVVQDLTEMSSADTVATISVLHALEFRAFTGLDRLMLAVSKECAAPIVSLTGFEIQKLAANSLPIEFMVQRGVLVFEFIGKEALVVLMNPYDEGLRQLVQKLVNQKCHFFMALPSEFDLAIARVREQVTGAPAGT